jgi:hypothetical protein
MIIMGELRHGFNVTGSSAKSFKHSTKISSLLHRDDTKLIFFIHPHQKCFLGIVEDATP